VRTASPCLGTRGRVVDFGKELEMEFRGEK